MNVQKVGIKRQTLASHLSLAYQLDLMGKVAKQSTSFCNSQVPIPDQERRQRLKDITTSLNEAIKRGEEKFALAKSTYDAVSRNRRFVTSWLEIQLTKAYYRSIGIVKDWIRTLTNLKTNN